MDREKIDFVYGQIRAICDPQRPINSPVGDKKFYDSLIRRSDRVHSLWASLTPCEQTVARAKYPKQRFPHEVK